MPPDTLEIGVDDLGGEEIAAFLGAHVREMRATAPPESTHVMDLDALRAADVTVWSAWQRGRLVACAAIKALHGEHAELKSMRTAPEARGQGIGARMLEHVVAASRARGFRRLSLETGSMAVYAPARRLYERFGFRPCAPFGAYSEDPNSAFYTLELDAH